MTSSIRPIPAKPSRFWRALLSIVGLVVLVIAFVIIFEYPQYGLDALCLLIAWIAASFAVLYILRRPRVPSVPPGGSA